MDNEVTGVKVYDKLPEWVRKKYYDTIKGECSLCKKHMLYNDMEVHRIKRGSNGGKYTLCKITHPEQNCVFVHSECHKLLHEGEQWIQ